MSNSPVRDRVSVQAPEGVIRSSGVPAFRKRYSDPSSAEPFFVWSNQMETKLAADALRDLSLNGPLGMQNPPQDALIQYGMSLGLALAAQLLSDPTLVFPELFRGRPAAMPESVDADYSASPETTI